MQLADKFILKGAWKDRDRPQQIHTLDNVRADLGVHNPAPLQVIVIVTRPGLHDTVCVTPQGIVCICHVCAEAMKKQEFGFGRDFPVQ